jgi:hypothetical protein
LGRVLVGWTPVGYPRRYRLGVLADAAAQLGDPGSGDRHGQQRRPDPGDEQRGTCGGAVAAGSVGAFRLRLSTDMTSLGVRPGGRHLRENGMSSIPEYLQ